MLILLPFLSVAQQESGTRKVIFWSVTVYNKNLSSQCKLISQIEPVQDKIHFHLQDIEPINPVILICIKL